MSSAWHTLTTVATDGWQHDPTTSATPAVCRDMGWDGMGWNGTRARDRSTLFCCIRKQFTYIHTYMRCMFTHLVASRLAGWPASRPHCGASIPKPSACCNRLVTLAPPSLAEPEDKPIFSGHIQIHTTGRLNSTRDEKHPSFFFSFGSPAHSDAYLLLKCRSPRTSVGRDPIWYPEITR
ncbi:hypothetical protein LY76DRAFT_383367 [Colletotrichum caudatum]|nr:hypothetical protein LY76DRAFT_383367 [Colletotrichum caudatum]